MPSDPGSAQQERIQQRLVQFLGSQDVREQASRIGVTRLQSTFQRHAVPGSAIGREAACMQIGAFELISARYT